VIKKKSAQASQ